MAACIFTTNAGGTPAVCSSGMTLRLPSGARSDRTVIPLSRHAAPQPAKQPRQLSGSRAFSSGVLWTLLRVVHRPALAVSSPAIVLSCVLVTVHGVSHHGPRNGLFDRVDHPRVRL